MKRVAMALAASVLASACEARAAGFEQPFERVPVAEGIVAYVATESPGGARNITVVSGTQASLVTDSGQYPELAAAHRRRHPRVVVADA
jgi:hypothetical protein